ATYDKPRPTPPRDLPGGRRPPRREPPDHLQPREAGRPQDGQDRPGQPDHPREPRRLRQEGARVMTFADLLSNNGWRDDDVLTLNRIEMPGYLWQTVVVPVKHAPKVVAEHLSERDAWYSVCPIRKDFQPLIKRGDRVYRQRGTEEDIVGLRALWTDLDVAPNKMPSMDAALDLVGVLSDHLGARPSSMVGSGHGLHPYWVIDDPLDWEPGDV